MVPIHRLISPSSVATPEIQHRSQTMQFPTQEISPRHVFSILFLLSHDIPWLHRYSIPLLRFGNVRGDHPRLAGVQVDRHRNGTDIPATFSILGPQMKVSNCPVKSPGSTCRPTLPMRVRWILTGGVIYWDLRRQMW